MIFLYREIVCVWVGVGVCVCLTYYVFVLRDMFASIWENSTDV
jgi:hypothetical protein